MGGLFYHDRLLGNSFVITKKLLQSPNSAGAIKSKLLTQMPTHQIHVFLPALEYIEAIPTHLSGLFHPQ
jgi:hypothetical protein